MCKEKEKRDCIDCPIGFEPVPDMPGLFVSTDGDVRLLNKNGDLIRPIFTVTGKGYLRITYCSGRYYVHRLVAQTYIANPRDCKYVNHKNGNKLDNRMENLEWVTASENWRHDPHTLISYLTAKYGDFTFSQVKRELESLFSEQYGIRVEETTETREETRTIRVGESLGNVVTSGYCNCPICCGVWSGGPTASGAMPQANHTIAVDASNPFLPMGTKVVMNGVEYTVEDTGNFARYGVQFDVYYDNHAAASAHGYQTWECFLAEGNANSVEVTRTVTADVLNVSLTAKPLWSVVQSRMDEEQKEIYEVVYSCRGNLQDYDTPIELNWYSYVSSYYGYSINNSTGRMELHRGVNINVREGTEVQSVMDGTVVRTGYDSTFGNYVVTQDEKGVQVKYAYLQNVSVWNRAGDRRRTRVRDRNGNRSRV